jgi:hypothetical protein
MSSLFLGTTHKSKRKLREIRQHHGLETHPPVPQVSKEKKSIAQLCAELIIILMMSKRAGAALLRTQMTRNVCGYRGSYLRIGWRWGN